jgi:hypothetical protein
MQEQNTLHRGVLAAHYPNIDHAEEAYQKISACVDRKVTVNSCFKLKDNKKGAYHQEQ